MRIYLAVCLSAFLFSCSVSTEPEFKKVTNVKVRKLSLSDCKISSDLVFYNPNDVGCDVISTNINVKVNGVPSGLAKQTKKITLKALSSFELPVVVDFKPKEVFTLNNGLFTGALKLLKEKSVEIEYEGFVVIDVLGVEVPIAVDFTQEVELEKQ